MWPFNIWPFKKTRAAAPLRQPNGGKGQVELEAQIERAWTNGANTLSLFHLDGADISRLSGMPTLETLELTNLPVTDLTALATLPNLKSLKLANLPAEGLHLPDLPGLTDLTIQNTAAFTPGWLTGRFDQLERLTIRFHSLPDARALVGKTQLRALSVKIDGESALAPLAAMHALTEIELIAPAQRDLSALAGLAQLTTVALMIDPDADLSPLGACPRLSVLRPMKHAPIHDLAALAVPTLTELLIAVDASTDLTPLARLPRLSRLVLSLHGAVSLTPLAGHPSLSKLVLTATEGRLEGDLPPLPALTSFRAIGDGVTSLRGLDAAQRLTSLDIATTRVADLAPLAGLPRLCALELSDTDVADLSILKTLPSFMTPSSGRELHIARIPALADFPDLTDWANRRVSRDSAEDAARLAEAIAARL